MHPGPSRIPINALTNQELQNFGNITAGEVNIIQGHDLRWYPFQLTKSFGNDN